MSLSCPLGSETWLPSAGFWLGSAAGAVAGSGGWQLLQLLCLVGPLLQAWLPRKWSSAAGRPTACERLCAGAGAAVPAAAVAAAAVAAAAVAAAAVVDCAGGQHLLEVDHQLIDVGVWWDLRGLATSAPTAALLVLSLALVKPKVLSLAQIVSTAWNMVLASI